MVTGIDKLHIRLIATDICVEYLLIHEQDRGGGPSENSLLKRLLSNVVDERNDKSCRKP